MWKALFVALSPIVAAFVGWGAITREILPNGHRRTDGLEGLPTLLTARPWLLGVLVVVLLLLFVSMTLTWLTAAFLLTIPVIALGLFILLKPPGRRGQNE